MKPFTYLRAAEAQQAMTQITMQPEAKFVAGGTNLIDLMKLGVETPACLVDINRLPLADVEELPNKGIRIGALARNSDVALHPLIAERYPVLSQALLAGASPQLRNVATIGGNIMQRTRCYYFTNLAFPRCNKRQPGSGCGAVDGFNRIHAILGQSDQCIATNPSDMNVALAALEAVVRVHGPRGEREIRFADFHRLPGNTPNLDTNLQRDELITAIDLPPLQFAQRSSYLKVRDRATYAFALVSVAAILDINANRKIREARIALGGVAQAMACLCGRKAIGRPACERAGVYGRRAHHTRERLGVPIQRVQDRTRQAQHRARVGDDCGNNMKTATIGPARSRVDGRLKVTGGAKYAVEFDVPNCAYAVTVSSAIASGTIVAIDTEAARAIPGVMTVLTHTNAPKLSSPPNDKEQQTGIRNEERLPFSDATVHYAGQYLALVVAKSLEQARYAASLVRVSYAQRKSALTMDAARAAAERPEQNNGDEVQIAKGNLETTLHDPELVKVEATYITPVETHNPIEMSGTIAAWDGDTKLTVNDATQFVKGVQHTLAVSFGLDVANVRVICPFVGGAFGCKGAVWPHVLLAAMAAKAAGVPVKLHISRQDMFTGTGHRTPTRQSLALAATRDGKLRAMRHVTKTCTSTVGQYVESCGARSTAVLYDSPVIHIEESVYPVNVATPTFMRAPGECPGTYALECAMDELAIALDLDPVQLRMLNHADNHPTKNVPFSAKFLKDCYALGAERFGWAKRDPKPRSMRNGALLVGWGMATATYPAYRMMAAVKVQLRADSTATLQCASHDLGTGAYTAFTQIASEQLGVPFENVTFELGNSDFPFGPVAGGSNSTGTVGTAIHHAAQRLHKALAELATKDSRSPLYNMNVGDIAMSGPGRIGAGAKFDSYTDILRRAGRSSIEIETQAQTPDEDKTRAFQSFGAHFVEVHIDPLLPSVRVTRVVSVMNNGRVVTAKPARSQILGGVVMGIGMALTEETVYDTLTGLPVTRNLADYHVPTNADIPDIEVHFVGEPDYAFNPIGARGMGEIGITGVAAAIANAVYHATGKRVRELPITLDKLLDAV